MRVYVLYKARGANDYSKPEAITASSTRAQKWELEADENVTDAFEVENLQT